MSMTPAARKVASGALSSLALLLCVIVLSAAVDSEGTTNVTLVRQGPFSWAEDNTDDDPDTTTYGDAAIDGKFSLIPFENDSDMRIIRSAIHSARVVISSETRAPPPFGGIATHSLVSFESTDVFLVVVVHVLSWFQFHLPHCVLGQVRSRAVLLWKSATKGE